MKGNKFHIGNKVQNNGGDENGCLELYFMDTIRNDVNFFTGEEESMLAQIINKVNEVKPKVVRQCIDSWGGSAPVGLGVYNYLKDKGAHGAKRVETKILNNCASIASVMACAGDKGYITMPRNGIMVIHKASGSAQGTAEELREAADVIDVYTENVLDVYVQNNRKGKTRDELFDLIKDGDYWMTGDQAKMMGFIDDTFNDENVTITNSINLAIENYGEVPNHITALAEKEGKNFFNNLFNKFKMEVSEILNGFKSDIKNNTTVPAEIQNNVFNTLEKPLENVLNAINKSITDEKTAALDSVTNKVTEIKNEFSGIIEGLKNEIKAFGDTVTAQEEVITSQKETIDAQAVVIEKIKNDIRKMQGKPTPASGKETNDSPTNEMKTFAGRMKFHGGESSGE